MDTETEVEQAIKDRCLGKMMDSRSLLESILPEKQQDNVNFKLNYQVRGDKHYASDEVFSYKTGQPNIDFRQEASSVPDPCSFPRTYDETII